MSQLYKYFGKVEEYNSVPEVEPSGRRFSISDSGEFNSRELS
jgi:hypothetical protein